MNIQGIPGKAIGALHEPRSQIATESQCAMLNVFCRVCTLSYLTGRQKREFDIDVVI
jgi:hypothetical protein